MLVEEIRGISALALVIYNGRRMFKNIIMSFTDLRIHGRRNFSQIEIFNFFSKSQPF